MLSISVPMTLVSFVLLPVVGALTFVFRFYSRKAYKITRNKITEPEHLPLRAHLRYEADPGVCPGAGEV